MTDEILLLERDMAIVEMCEAILSKTDNSSYATLGQKPSEGWDKRMDLMGKVHEAKRIMQKKQRTLMGMRKD
jgi:hypothetical protein